MKNIAFYLPNITSAGGVERALITLVNELSYSNEFNIFLITNIGSYKNAAFLVHSKVFIIELGILNYKRSYFKLSNRLLKVLIHEKIDVFVTVETLSMMFTFFPFLFLRKKCKYVVWEHFNIKNNSGVKLRDYFRYLASKKADLIITLTERDKIAWKKHYKVKASLTNIFNISPFQNTTSKYNVESKNIIAIGRFDKVKGFDRLIKAWSLFELKYGITDWKLQIVGYGPEKESLESILINKNCINIEIIDSNSSDIIQYYKEASFYCMSSYSEGLGLVMIEAQSYNLPIVAFDIFAGPSEIIAEKAGILVEDNNLEAFADAIYKLTSSDTLRMELSQEACILKHRFSKEVIGKRWLHEFTTLLNK